MLHKQLTQHYQKSLLAGMVEVFRIVAGHCDLAGVGAGVVDVQSSNHQRVSCAVTALFHQNTVLPVAVLQVLRKRRG